MYQVKVNDGQQFEIEVEKNQFTVNQLPVAIDRVSLTDAHAHVLYKNKSYNVEIVAENSAEKTVEIKVNGHRYVVEVKDQYDQLLKQLGLDILATNKVRETKAPMPGLVLDILVEVGQEVQKGDNLLVLEAMKMENIIKSAAQGTVKAILVQRGAKVEKNTILLQFV